MPTRDEIAIYVHNRRRSGAGWEAAQSPWTAGELNFMWSMGLSPQPITPERVQALADALYADAEFRALQLATFLNSPDGKLIAEAVGIVVPLGPEYDLWVAAMQQAAQMQYTEGAKPAGRVALAATALLLGLFLFASLVQSEGSA